MRCAYHDPAACLEADVFEIPQTAHPACEGQLRRMQHRVVLRIRRLVPKKVAPRPRIVQRLIELPAEFSDGHRHRAVRPALRDAPHYMAHLLLIIIRILSALQDEGPEPMLIAVRAASEDVLFIEPVSLHAAVAAADAAVITVVPADVRELDNAAEVDPPAEALERNAVGYARSVLQIVCIPCPEDLHPFRFSEAAFFIQFVYEFLVFHFLCLGTQVMVRTGRDSEGGL